MDPLMLSRMQFGITAAFHILWPIMSIGTALYLVIMETLWFSTKKESYYRQTRFWTKLFVLSFSIGTASGLPLAFQFGTNWAAFARMAGDFMGNILGFETTIAFALEAAFLAIFIFGWKRVPAWLHLFSAYMVFIGASISAFWIMAANSWMQTPAGIVIENGTVRVTDYAAAIFNPDTLVSYMHMMGACVETSLFLIGGIAAWRLLTTAAGPVHEFFRRSLIYSFAAAIFVALLQLISGDLSGLVIAKYQPEKVAAIELHWNANEPGTGAAWNIVALPDAQGDGNSFVLSVPNGLSLLTTHSTVGVVPGLNDFPADNRPSVPEATVSFYAFRIMIAIGFIFIALVAWGCWLWWRGELSSQRIMHHRWWLFGWAASIPLGFIGAEAGWITREIGRQPWMIYHYLRVSDSVSPGLVWYEVAGTLTLITLAYLVFISVFVYFTVRIVRAGPDLSSPLP